MRPIVYRSFGSGADRDEVRGAQELRGIRCHACLNYPKLKQQCKLAHFKSPKQLALRLSGNERTKRPKELCVCVQLLIYMCN